MSCFIRIIFCFRRLFVQKRPDPICSFAWRDLLLRARLRLCTVLLDLMGANPREISVLINNPNHLTQFYSLICISLPRLPCATDLDSIIFDRYKSSKLSIASLRPDPNFPLFKRRSCINFLKAFCTIAVNLYLSDLLSAA